MGALGVETTVRDDVLQVARPGTEWLSTGFDGGRRLADAAYNLTVPDGWGETDLAGYVRERWAAAGFERPGPTLLTGVSQRHARLAVCEPVCAVVTAGVSNPATLPPRAAGGRRAADRDSTDGDVSDSDATADDAAGSDAAEFRPGTINVVAVTTRALAPGALANLVAVVTEAKTATLLDRTGFTGTTSDAVVVGCDPTGEPAAFSGSATPVGRAARACVRDALGASLDSRYADESIPDSVADAEHGHVTSLEPTVSRPG